MCVKINCFFFCGVGEVNNCQFILCLRALVDWPYFLLFNWR
jgi:hypothetical protein